MERPANKDIYETVNRYLFGKEQEKKDAQDILKENKDDYSGIIEGFISRMPRRWERKSACRHCRGR
jgi:hypothetical protein